MSWLKPRPTTKFNWIDRADLGRSVLRPYIFGGECLGMGEVGSKPRDLGSDRGYRARQLGGAGEAGEEGAAFQDVADGVYEVVTGAGFCYVALGAGVYDFADGLSGFVDREE